MSSGRWRASARSNCRPPQTLVRPAARPGAEIWPRSSVSSGAARASPLGIQALRFDELPVSHSNSLAVLQRNPSFVVSIPTLPKKADTVDQSLADVMCEAQNPLPKPVTSVVVSAFQRGTCPKKIHK